MNVFVINLAKDTTRRLFMESQLQLLGLSPRFIEATNGRQLTDKEIGTIYDAEMAQAAHGHQLSKTQIACAHSHRRVYEIMQSENLPWALILEDDVRLDSKVTQILNDGFINSSQADWLQIDYLPFDSSFLKNWYQATVVRSKRNPLFLLYALAKLPFLLVWGMFEKIREDRAAKKKPRPAIFPRPLYLASAYIITAEGVNKLLPLCTPIRYAADQVQNQARIKSKLILRGIVPLLAKQDRQQFESNLVYDNQ